MRLSDSWESDTVIIVNEWDITAPAYINRHSLTINGKNENIRRADLEVIAQRNDIQDYKSLLDIVSNAVAKFREFALELKIDVQIIDNMESDFVRL